MKKYKFILLSFIIITTGIVGCAGGGGEFNSQLEPATFRHANTLNMNVLLVIDENYISTKWADETGVSGWEASVVHLGNNFAINTKSLASSIFSNVTVVNSFDKALKMPGDSILKPTVVAVVKNRPMWRTADSTMTVALEWSLTDINSVPIWVTTIIGEGSAGITDDEERVRALIDDLFNKSYNEIVSSSEIANFVSSLNSHERQ